MKISFHSFANKTNFHVKNFALSLALIMKFTATQKWPIRIVTAPLAFPILYGILVHWSADGLGVPSSSGALPSVVCHWYPFVHLGRETRQCELKVS